MVAKILSKAAQEAKEIWDSYNKKGGKNYDKKFDDDKFYGKSRGTTPTPENKRKQEKKLISEKRKLRKKDPEKYRDVTKSGLTRKGIKPEQGPYESQGKLYSNQRNDKKTRELEKRLSEGRQKYSKKMGKASRGEGSYKDGGMPMPKPKPKRTITKEQLDSLPRDMIGVLKMLAKKQLTQDEERKLKKSAKTDSRIVKEDTPPKPKRKPTGPSPRRGKGLKSGGTLRVLKKGVVRGSYS